MRKKRGLAVSRGIAKGLDHPIQSHNPRIWVEEEAERKKSNRKDDAFAIFWGPTTLKIT